MIEINLLPPQYRTVERTPLPIFLSLIAALVLIGGAVWVYVEGVKEAHRLEDERAAVEQRLEDLRQQAAAFQELVAEINEARARVTTVLNIGESRVPWSIVLGELVALMPDYIWIDSLTFERRRDGSGEMRMATNARGTSLDRVAEFKHILRSESSFFYHFDRVVETRIAERAMGPGYVEPKVLSFNLSLPLVRGERGAN